MFPVFSKAVHERFLSMSGNELYVVEIENIFDKYLAAFPPGTNPVFKTRTEYDCSTCKQFIRNLGRVIGVKNGQIQTLWEDLDIPEPYQTVAQTMDCLVRSGSISHVYRTKERKYGVEHNYGPDTHLYNHFYGEIGAKHYSATPDVQRGECDAIFQVFKRGLSEIRLTDIDIILELIDSNGLYRGAEFRDSVIGFKNLLKDYSGSDLFIWENLHNRNSRFRNTVIGTLLTDLCEGKDVEDAVKSFEVKVAPINYKRPTSIITQSMVENAVQTLNTLGLGGAIYRRYARISDISVNDVLFVDNSVQLKDNVAELLKGSIKTATPDTKKAQQITPDYFVSNILPAAKTVDLIVENRHTGNFVSLTGSDGPERIFKWENNFAWSYDGDVTDSVKQRVKAAGGNINAKLRISLSWFNTDDLDLHAHSPFDHIYFGNKVGILDVDMNVHNPVRNPVENLAFNDLRDGVYDIKVNQYRQRETTDFGFAIEVESAGILNQYQYPKTVKNTIDCFKLHVKNNQLVKIETTLVGGNISKEKWGIKTETITPVTAIMYSPNHWGDQHVGAKHLIFALRDCKNPDPTRGIYNEYLRSDFEKHRKVFEVLGSKTKCQPTDNQISGLGFTSARGDTVTVIVDGKRLFNITF